jgi:cell division protein FtsQ
MRRFRRSPGGVLLLILLALLIYILGWSHLLALKRIVIHGTQAQSSIQQSLDAAKPRITIGEPLARIDVRAVSRVIRKNEWITRVEVGRSWIHGSLTIFVDERKPVASYLDSQGRLRYFDATGVDFQSPLTYNRIPIITLGHDDPDSRRVISKFLEQLPSDLLDQIQSFTVKSSSEIETKVATPSKNVALVKWGPPSDISLKIAIYKKLLALKENSQAILFDLRDPLSPVTK